MQQEAKSKTKSEISSCISYLYPLQVDWIVSTELLRCYRFYMERGKSVRAKSNKHMFVPPTLPHPLLSLSLSHLPIDQISCKRSVTQACSMCFQFLLSLHLSITTTKSSLFTPSPPPCSPHNVLPRPRPRRRQDKKRREERRDTTERVVPERRPTTLDFIPSSVFPHSPLRLCAFAPSSSDASSSSSSSSTSQISMKTGEMEMFWGKQYFRSFFPASH